MLPGGAGAIWEGRNCRWPTPTTLGSPTFLPVNNGSVPVSIARRGRWRLVLALSAGVAVVSACGVQAARSSQDAAVVPVRVVVGSLSQPVHVVPAPSGREDRLFVVEQGGRVRIAEGDRVLPRPFLDLRSVVAHGGLRGLLSLAFHPQYVVNGRAYVYYVGRDGATYLAEIRTIRGFAASRRVLLRIPASRDPYAHYGGHVLFGRTAFSTSRSEMVAIQRRPKTRTHCLARSSGSMLGGRTQDQRSLLGACVIRGASRSFGTDRRS